MIPLEWNALRVGQHVLVHAEDMAGMPLVPGKVTTVTPTGRSNEVSIRITPEGGPSRVVSPRRPLVHPEHLSLDEHCWRCAVTAESPPSSGRTRSTSVAR